MHLASATGIGINAVQTVYLNIPHAAIVDNLVHAPRPESPLPQFLSEPSTSGRQGRSVTPTVIESGGEARPTAAASSRDGHDRLSRDANGNRVKEANTVAAVDRPVEDLVAAGNYGLKRRSNCLHQSSSGESAGSVVGDGCGRPNKEKRTRIDP